MKPAAFDYMRVRSLEQALDLLARHGEDARVLAGGQSLVPTLNMRLSAPAILVDINPLSDLGTVESDRAWLSVGAMVRHARLGRNAEVARAAPLLALAVPHIAHPAIRNRGTVGGSVAFADPAAELPACLLALDGEVEIAGPGGASRRVPAEDFFKGLYETDLDEGELLTAVRVPAAEPEARFGFAEIARRHGDYAMAGLAAAARWNGDGLASVRLAYFAVGEKPARAKTAEQALAAGDVDAAVAALAQDLEPIEDVQTSAATRLHLAGVLLRRVAGQLRQEEQLS